MYTLAVKIEGIERRKKSTGVLHLAVGFFLLIKTVDYFKYRQFNFSLAVALLFLVVIVALVYGFFKRKIDPAAHYNHWLRTIEFLAFAVLGILLTNVGQPLDYLTVFAWAIICLFLMFTERKIFHDAKMLFKREGIFIPGYFSNRQIFWKNILDIVARQDFVTIFFSGNRFLQYEVTHVITEQELAELNQFCKKQIAHFSQTTAS